MSSPAHRPGVTATEKAPPGMRGVGPTLPYPLKAALTRGRSAAWMLRGRPRRAEGLRILLYHRIADDGDPLAVTPRRFREQMDLLGAQGYRAVDLDEILALLDGDGPLPPRTIGLTFDDGFTDVAENAHPVLARHGFTATVFVTTGVTDGRHPFPWYRDQPPVLDWDDVVALDREGVLRFEAHTVTHPNLLTTDHATAEREIERSREELEEHLGRPVTAFAYPAGLYGDRERRLVAEAGYAAAVTCEPGLNVAQTDRFALRRRQIDSRDTLLDFRAKVAGGHDTPLPFRGHYRRLRYGMGPPPAARESSPA
ncbi:polysaccharide deacetylase family protein [Capillimicrobium parvum]|uniref:polysaccharide deacetylase family protein n=1 Tax=Capillimicrobium parvum TaxID=2884022 RepID=UPI00216AED41|nr:polysaccharide deacetylase family protein [Capillimicrobium parvum]